MENIYDILTDARTGTSYDSAYQERMIHPVPEATSVDRVEILREYCTGKVVLHLGCAGPLHGQLEEVASKVYGVDMQVLPLNNFTYVDLDGPSLDHYTVPDDVEVVLLAEVLEHLTNPGRLLQHLRQTPALKVITVPNAFTLVGIKHLETGQENVNKEHVAYYSWRTLTTLVERYEYTVQEWHWYNGPPKFAEGLIFVVK